MTPEPSELTSISVQDRTDLAFRQEAPLVFWMAALADSIPVWPSRARDMELDSLWRGESMLAGAMYSMCARQSALDFKLTGPRRLVTRSKDVLQSAEFGAGWIRFLFKVTQDVLSQDNGGFIEIMRKEGRSSTAPADGIAQLDSQRCELTGDPEQPVNYEDINGVVHRLMWYDVASIVDMPSSREEHKGTGFCAISRILRTAQVIRDIGIYKRQKLSGKRVPGIIFVQGVRKGEVEASIMRAQEQEIQMQGRTLYSGPVVIAGPDPGLPLNAQMIELAGLPDGFNEDVVYKWYITALALAFGTDYSDFAPLPGGNLGTASQVEGMSARARGKGPGVITQQFEYALNYKILPASVEFQFLSSDPAAENSRVELSHVRARERALRVNSQELTPLQALKLAVAEGDAPESFLQEALGQAQQMVGPDVLPDSEEGEDRIQQIIRAQRELNDSYRYVEEKYTEIIRNADSKASRW